MKKTPLHLKTINPSEVIFYWYNIGESMYALYDSDMGEPVSYGSINLVVGTLRAINAEVVSGKRKSCTVYFFKRDGSIGWKKTTPPVLFNWKSPHIDKNGDNDSTTKNNVDNKR